MNKLKICANLIENELLAHDCEVDTTYDVSHLLLKSVDEDNEVISEIFRPPKFYTPLHYQVDEDEQRQNYKAFMILVSKIKHLLLSNDCTFESSYDYSSVFLYDRFGNSAVL